MDLVLARLDLGLAVGLGAALLDAEQVGEVGVEVELDRAVGRFLAVVGDEDAGSGAIGGGQRVIDMGDLIHHLLPAESVGVESECPA